MTTVLQWSMDHFSKFLVSENTIGDWKTLIHTRVADYLVPKPSPLGGPGIIEEMNKAKLGRQTAKVL